MNEVPTVPAPLAPGDAGAWYAPDVRTQYAVHPGVVVTIRETSAEFEYETREPALSATDARSLERVRTHFEGANTRPPRTREGAAERLRAGFSAKYERALDRLSDCSSAGRRRLDYHVLRDLRCLGELTPHALDDRIEVADTATDDRLVVHTADYAPVLVATEAREAIDRFASERIARYAVPFEGFETPVVVYRERVLGDDPFETKYAVLEPDLLPGDEALIAECKARIWEARVERVVDDRSAFVRDRAETLLSRRLTARNTRAWLDASRFRARSALAEYGLVAPPVDRKYARDRLDDLVYYVLRDFVGEGKLTVPIRDDRLEDVEANRVGERVKVVPRMGVHDGRVPTNLAFESESEFVSVVTQLAATDGVELNASTPSAKVNVDVGTGETVRCAVALPTISEGGPHISIRKQAPDALTPPDLVRAGSLPTELVALLWMLYEHRGVVLFAGPTGVGKTTLMNAHTPFIPYESRPISIDEGSREVQLPHETGVSLTTRDHEQSFKRVTMADLMTETNYLNPDVEVIAEINTPASFETFAQTLQTGHGVLGTTHAEDVEKLVNRVIEQGLPPYLLREIDLVVFPRHVDGERYVGEAVELLTDGEFAGLDRRSDACGTIDKAGATVHWNRVTKRAHGGGFSVAFDPAGRDGASGDRRTRVFERLAGRTDRPVSAVEAEFERKHSYVEYLCRAGIDEYDALFAFLADLRNDEAATVERIRHREAVDG